MKIAKILKRPLSLYLHMEPPSCSPHTKSESTYSRRWAISLFLVGYNIIKSSKKNGLSYKLMGGITFLSIKKKKLKKRGPGYYIHKQVNLP